LDAAKNDNWIAPIRTSFARVGLWPAIAAIFSLSVTLITLGQKTEILRYAVGVVGVLGLLYYGFLYLKFRSFVSTIKTNYTGPKSHAEKLGLQAAIGLDLRALLIGWMPKDYFVRRYWRETLWPIALYLLAVLAVGCQIWLYMPHERIAVAIAPILVWATATLVVPALILRSKEGPKRVLLVVDDLDRCPPLQMLEIVESVMLLLDDEEINRRLQIAMLVEESSLSIALSKKYGFLRDEEHRDEADKSKALGRVVRENVEKLFLIHLRLPPASDRGLGELMEKFVEQLSEPLQSNRGGTETSQSSPSGVIVPEVSADDRGTIREVREDADVKFTLSREERDRLVSAVGNLRGSSYQGTWGPRSVRCFLFRYQLARLLLSRLGHVVNPERLVQSLVKAQSEENAGTEADDLSLMIENIANQVS
jgi:hypothetical protein